MQVRKANADDMGFVFETFLRSIRQASTHVEGLSNGQVFALLAALQTNGWQLAVADAYGYLAGWICWDKDRIGWFYVRDKFRNKNYKDYPVARLLLDFADPGFMTSNGKRIVTPFLPNRSPLRDAFIHRPFLILPNA